MFTVTTDTDGELSRIVHTRSARYYETATPGHPMLTLAECRSAMLQYQQIDGFGIKESIYTSILWQLSCNGLGLYISLMNIIQVESYNYAVDIEISI